MVFALAFGPEALKSTLKSLLLDNRCILPLCLHLLGLFHSSFTILRNLSLHKPHPFPGLLSKLTNLIAILTYQSKQASEQAFLTHKEYLGLILSHTKMEDDNPTMREWCIMIIRNLCEESEGIREVLAQMKQVGEEDG